MLFITIPHLHRRSLITVVAFPHSQGCSRPFRSLSLPSANSDVNTTLAAYLAATDCTRAELEYALIKSLEKYAKKIVWLRLHEDRPDLVNEAVRYVLAHLADFKGNSKFSTYVFSIVERLCYREIKRKTTSKESVFSDFKEHEVDGLATYELDGDAKITLDRLRKTVSTDENQLINLRLQGYRTAQPAVHQWQTVDQQAESQTVLT